MSLYAPHLCIWPSCALHNSYIILVIVSMNDSYHYTSVLSDPIILKYYHRNWNNNFDIFPSIVRLHPIIALILPDILHTNAFNLTYLLPLISTHSCQHFSIYDQVVYLRHTGSIYFTSWKDFLINWLWHYSKYSGKYDRQWVCQKLHLDLF